MDYCFRKRNVEEGLYYAFSDIREEMTLEEEIFYYVVKLFSLTSISKIRDKHIHTVKITSIDMPCWKGIRTLESGSFKQLKGVESIANVKDAMCEVAEFFNEHMLECEAVYEEEANNGAGVLTVNFYIP